MTDERPLSDTEFVAELLARAHAKVGDDPRISFHLAEHNGPLPSAQRATISEPPPTEATPSPQAVVWGDVTAAAVELASLWKRSWISDDVPAAANVVFDEASSIDGIVAQVSITGPTSSTPREQVVERLIGAGWIDSPADAEDRVRFTRDDARLSAAWSDNGVTLTLVTPLSTEIAITPLDLAYLPATIDFTQE